MPSATEPRGVYARAPRLQEFARMTDLPPAIPGGGGDGGGGHQKNQFGLLL